MKQEYIPFIVAVLGGIAYQTSQKLMPKVVNPLLALAYVYFLAFLVCLVYVIINKDINKDITIFTQLKWPMVTLAIGTLMIEIGYLYAFRYGLPLSSFGLTVTGSVAVILLFGKRYRLRQRR